MEDSNVKSRLLEYLKSKNITQAEFGRTIGVSGAYVASIRRSIDIDKLRLIAINYPDLNQQWLLYGEGQMLNGINIGNALSEKLEPVTPQEQSTIIGGSQLSNDMLLAALRESQAQTTKSQEQIDRLLGLIETLTIK